MTDTKLSKEEISTIEASAHCDGPCGVYDPASARVAAEAVQSMTKKMMSLDTPDSQSEQFVGYLNTCHVMLLLKKKKHKNVRMNY